MSHENKKVSYCSRWAGYGNELAETNNMLNKCIGKTISEIEGAETQSDTIIFCFSDGSKLTMTHIQDCCERVDVEDICGDVSDLIGLPLCVAEESVNSDDPSPNAYSESHTWTFYRFATNKGWVVIRWLGESNGYYSESVDLYYNE